MVKAVMHRIFNFHPLFIFQTYDVWWTFIETEIIFIRRYVTAISRHVMYGMPRRA